MKALFLAALVLVPTAALSAATPHALPASVVLANYAQALATHKEPRAVSFDYTLEQTGVRALDQRHRVFRSGRDERDEVLVVNGRELVTPEVRIFRQRRDRYAIGALAPNVAAYAFAFAGTQRNGHHLDYIFALTPKAPAAFIVTRVAIDGVTFLPNVIAFRVTGGGHGAVHYTRSERWWVPLSADASAHVDGALTTEHLIFSAYRFPVVLPASTFEKPRPLPTLPAAPE
jgi:hypothetical protein